MPFIDHRTLTASTVATITVTGNPSAVEILNRNGAGEVYVSYSPTGTPPDPTVGGAGFYVIPAAVGAFITIPDENRSTDINVVKVISAQATAISVAAVP